MFHFEGYSVENPVSYKFWYKNLFSRLPDQMVEKFGGIYFGTASKLMKKPDPLPVVVEKAKFDYPIGMPSGWIDEPSKFRIAMDLAVGIPIIKTITALPRKGNPYPRLVRGDGYLINSMGLPNKGLDWWKNHFSDLPQDFPIVVSIKGDNATEWIQLIDAFDPKATFIELNFSCPNISSGIMDVEKSIQLFDEIAGTSNKLWVKLSPEHSPEQNLEFVKKIRDNILGITLINTLPTKNERLGNPAKTGGISGEKIFPKLKAQLKRFREEYPTFNELPIFATGGITPDTAPLVLTEFKAIPFMLTAFLINGPKVYTKAIERIRTVVANTKIDAILNS